MVKLGIASKDGELAGESDNITLYVPRMENSSLQFLPLGAYI
jgi:hypothetical protein